MSIRINIMYEMVIVSLGTVVSNLNFVREQKECKTFKRFKIVNFLITFKIVNLLLEAQI